MLKDMDFYHLLEIFLANIEKRLFDTGINAFKNLVHKTGEIADAVANYLDDKIVKLDENSRNVEKIIFPPEQREELLNQLIQVL